MLSPQGQYGLEAKFCGLGLSLIGFGLGLVLGLVKHWPCSHIFGLVASIFFMWYIKWKINMSIVRKITVSWTSSAVAKGYYLLKCLAMLIQSDWCRFYVIQEIRSMEHGYLSHCFKSTTHDLGDAPFGVIHRPVCSTSHGLSNKEKTKGLASSV